ncbi:MAG: porin, partial [Parasphingopyxis sp.]
MRGGLLLLSVSAAALLQTPAIAADAETAAELQALRDRVATLEALVTRLTEGQASTAAEAAEASAAAQAAQASATETAALVAAQPEVTFGAAPEVESDDGWSFKPFGRIQYDVGYVGDPDLNDPGLGFSNELRRGRLGVEGDIPGGFGYKLELDFAEGGVEITDAILTYDAGDFDLTVGQHNPFQTLEELTSSRFISFMERAAFTDAFGFERRVGASVGYA